MFGLTDLSNNSIESLRFGDLSDNPIDRVRFEIPDPFEPMMSPMKRGRSVYNKPGEPKNPIIEEQVIATDSSDNDTYSCDIVFSFDTTGSMRSIIKSVREHLVETIDRLFIEVPNIRIGILVHGDYCDSNGFFWKLDLGRNKEQIKNFIINAKDTGGGDAPECYEFVLNQAPTMNWKSEVKVLVLIGDQKPHEEGYSMPERYIGFTNTLHINWKNELENCKRNKITVFSCHALPEQNEDSVYFYHTISSETGGYYFPLSELQSFPYYMVTICMRASDADEDLKILREKQAQLKELIETNKLRPEETQSARDELADLDRTLHIARQTSVFSPEVINYSSRVRRDRNISSRAETYINEINSQKKTENIFRTTSAEAFCSTISSYNSEH